MDIVFATFIFWLIKKIIRVSICLTKLILKLNDGELLQKNECKLDQIYLYHSH